MAHHNNGESTNEPRLSAQDSRLLDCADQLRSVIRTGRPFGGASGNTYVARRNNYDIETTVLSVTDRMGRRRDLLPLLDFRPPKRLPMELGPNRKTAEARLAALRRGRFATREMIQAFFDDFPGLLREVTAAQAAQVRRRTADSAREAVL